MTLTSQWFWNNLQPAIYQCPSLAGYESSESQKFLCSIPSLTLEERHPKQCRLDTSGLHKIFLRRFPVKPLSHLPIFTVANLCLCSLQMLFKAFITFFHHLWRRRILSHLLFIYLETKHAQFLALQIKFPYSIFCSVGCFCLVLFCFSAQHIIFLYC